MSADPNDWLREMAARARAHGPISRDEMAVAIREAATREPEPQPIHPRFAERIESVQRARA